MRKVLVFMLCALILLSAVSCGNKTSDDTEKTEVVFVTDKNGETKAVTKKVKKSKNISLYFCYSDSLDPYQAKSSGNRSVCGLLFDSLIKLDNDLNPHKVLANDVTVSGKTVTITLNSYRFSDGDVVTTDDVIYSIEKCKKAKEGAYVNQLSNVKSYSASGGKVVLTLNNYDKNAICLLDFPIVKRGSVNKTNSDGKTVPPIGSGRYVLVDNFGEYSLKGNEYYYGGKPKNTIKLSNVPDYDALEYSIRSNSIDAYYSGFDAKEMPELKGKTGSVTLTNLVYLGINQSRSVLSDNNIRKALSASCDRTNISDKCYYSLSTPATSLFNNSNKVIENQKAVFELEDNAPNAAQFLSKSGYSSLNSEGYYQNSDKNHVSIGLLYNKDNSMQSMAAQNLVKQFKAGGIDVKEDPADKNSYKSRIKNKDYDIYLAEIRLTKSFNYFDLLNSKIVGKKTGKGKKATKSTDTFLKAYESYMKGDKSVSDMLASFSEELPFIPLVFRLGTVSYSKDFSVDLISSISDPYYNIEKISKK